MRNNIPTRRVLLALSSIGATTGLLSFMEKKAKATNPADTGILGLIKIEVVLIAKQVVEAVKVYNEMAKTSNSILGQAKDGVEIARDLRNYEETLSKSRMKIKKLVDGFYKVGSDPLSNKVPYIHPGSIPIISQTKRHLTKIDKITSSMKTTEGKDKLTSLGERKRKTSIIRTSAKDLREKVGRLKDASSDSTDKEKSHGRIFTENSGPVVADLMLAILETLSVQAEIQAEILDHVSGGVEIHKKVMAKTDGGRSSRTNESRQSDMFDEDLDRYQKDGSII